MDKEVLNYLDKAGQYLQGAGEKGFKTYVHGVWVESLIFISLGLLIAFIGVGVFLFFFKHSKVVNEDETYRDEDFITAGLVCLGVFVLMGLPFVILNITGVFAPDYVAIKEMLRK
ncbi:hypothetical protein [Staphylococcus ureilyticus]|uniref:hypothetical protein n=1 Tax=Staphylococcus ureilyticus TaxID=94138 RepID=UPI0021D0C4AA|nr:hypothetical protein [Staphylococcus ureilyticus]UXS61006.1 hypothetical protein MUA21_05265 [Staphylococcus ureilyticus]